MNDSMKDIDIIKELDSRGHQGRKIGDNLMLLCPYHSENTPSFGIAFKGPNKGKFNCLGCHEGGDFFKLISLLDDVSLSQTKKKYGKDLVADHKTINGLKSHFMKFLNSVPDVTNKIRIIDPSILNNFKKPYGKFLEYLHGKNRKLNEETISKWEILCCDKDFEDKRLFDWKNRVIVPMYDSKHRLISILARSILKDVDKVDKVRKFKGGQRKRILFGMSFIKKGTPIVLVEGEFDCIYLSQFGVPAVSIGTTAISDVQIQKIAKFTDSVALSLDGDTYRLFNKRTGENLKTEAYKKLSKFVRVDVIQLPIDKDPNELNEEEVKRIYKKYLLN
jgi:DNA primase